jgi:outer membrane protein assembly factor BamB
VEFGGENVYALDLQTGEQLWRTKIRGSISTTLTIRDGTVYFCNESGGELWMLDAEGGEVLCHSYP